MKPTDIVLDIPVFKLEQVKWVIKLPQFTVINVNAEMRNVQDESAQLSKDADAVGAAMKQEMTQAITDYLNPKGAEDVQQRDTVKQQFDSAITRVGSAITEVSAAGGNPSTVPDGKGGQVDLRQQQAQISTQEVAALQQIDGVLQQIHDAHP